MFRKILSVVTLLLVCLVVWDARTEIFAAINYLSQTNLAVIALLVPEQLFMYFCAGQMFFSYMAVKPEFKKMSILDLMSISFELNFVNHAVPSGGVSGLGYIAWRLHQFGASVGQVSFMYLLRYAITICANQAQTIVAIIFLVIAGGLSTGAVWLIWLTCLMSLGIITVIVFAMVIASNRQRVDRFSIFATKLLNSIAKKITFGRKQQLVSHKTVHKFMMDLHNDLIIARNNKKILTKPIIWGIVYSFLEVATYWVVGISMGHPEILPQIMVAESIGSVIGAVLVTPGGVGGYEGAMIFVMSTLGVPVGLASAVVITTRVVVLVGTITSGYGLYQRAISKIGKKDRANLTQKPHAKS